MKLDLKFLVVSYIIGLFIDWVFQWSWQANNKSRWGKNDNKMLSLAAVTSHALVYALLTSFITLPLIGKMSHFLTVFTTLFISHAIIDTRIPVKYLMRFKGMSWEEIYDYKNSGFMHIGIDHRLHEIVLLVLAMII